MIDQIITIITLNVNYLILSRGRDWKVKKKKKEEGTVYITHTSDPKIQGDGK